MWICSWRKAFAAKVKPSKIDRETLPGESRTGAEDWRDYKRVEQGFSIETGIL